MLILQLDLRYEIQHESQPESKRPALLVKRPGVLHAINLDHQVATARRPDSPKFRLPPPGVFHRTAAFGRYTVIVSYPFHAHSCLHLVIASYMAAEYPPRWRWRIPASHTRTASWKSLQGVVRAWPNRVDFLPQAFTTIQPNKSRCRRSS